MGKIIFDMNETKNIVDSMNNCIEDIDMLISKLETEYQEMSENVWFSKEKNTLDEIVNPTLEQLKETGPKMKTTTTFLNNYNNKYIEMYELVRSEIGTKG